MGLAAGLLIVTFIAVVGLAFGTARAVRGPGGPDSGWPDGGWESSGRERCWWDEGSDDEGEDPGHEIAPRHGSAPAEADTAE
jgi:hypothetical protein